MRSEFMSNTQVKAYIPLSKKVQRVLLLEQEPLAQLLYLLKRLLLKLRIKEHVQV